jgi:hypothetical protein
MTPDEALDLIRKMLKAPNEEELTQLITLNLSRFDGVFFGVLNQSVAQLKQDGKGQIATALENLGGTILRMRMLI